MKRLILLVVCSFFIGSCGLQNIGQNNAGQPLPNQNVNVNASTQPVLATNQAATNATPQTVTQSGAILNKVLISDVSNSKGSVETGKSTFESTTPVLNVSAYILKAQPGLKATAVLTYLPTKEQVGPVSNDNTLAGDIISNFSFSRPTAGWPSGNYTVVVTLSDGQNMTINFNVP